MKRNKGFTLIELLVVIVLIGILSGVMFSVINIGGIRAKSRDAQRVSDLKKIQTALELYFHENRRYPDVSEYGWWWWANDMSYKLTDGGYISVFPKDPIENASNESYNDNDPCGGLDHIYWYWGDAGGYVLAANMEVASSALASPCSGLKNWSVFGCENPPATCYGVENPF